MRVRAQGKMNSEQYMLDNSLVDAQKIRYNKMHINHCTFKGGLGDLVHRWFRMTPSYGPDLVQKALCKLNYSRGASVFDPFSGAGTTLIECQINDIKAFGTEINPLLHFVCDASLDWRLDIDDLERNINIMQARHLKEKDDIDCETLTEESNGVPKIHNPFRWWRKDVLRDIISLKNIINEESGSESERKLYNLALASALVPGLTNVTLGKLQLHFIDRTSHVIDVNSMYFDVLKLIVEDLRVLQLSPVENLAEVYLHDAVKPLPQLVGKNIDFVVTSPPYPNRYSYVWNTRPHLYMLDMFSTPKEASSLDLNTIGGTWGTATSVLSKGIVEPAFDVIKEVVSPVVEAIRVSDNLMANYVMKYFNMLGQQILTMDQYLAPCASIAYVVGNSRIKGEYVETDVLLSKIIDGLGLGFKIKEIDRFRKRNSGVDLYETVVYAERT